MSCSTVLNALIVVVGVSLSLEKAMKRIACTDGTIATKVRAALARYGILRGIYHIGPRLRDPTILLVLTAQPDPAAEPTIRQAIESIGGVTIQD
jgi:hypothetical protein